MSGSQVSVSSPSLLISAGSAEARVSTRNAPSVRTASSTSPLAAAGPSSVSVADLTAAATWSTLVAATRATPAWRTTRSRPSARRCEPATSASRQSTSR